MFGFNLLGYSSIMEIDRHQAQILVPKLTMAMGTATPNESNVSLEVGVITAQYDLGGFAADSLIAESAIGEGRTISARVDRIPRLNMQPNPPADIQSGVQILLSDPVQMTIMLPLAEIDSRRRKLKTQVILS